MKNVAITAQQRKEPPTLEELLKKKATKELLLFAAGKQMFCPGCSKILDWKTTIITTAKKDAKSGTLITCEKCFLPTGIQRLKDAGYTVEVDKWDY